MTIDVNAAYRPSDDIVARDIEGELIIVPLVAGIGDMEDELYTLNETGRAIWSKLDGARPLSAVIVEIASEYAADEGEVERDVCGLVEELAKRRMVVATGE